MGKYGFITLPLEKTISIELAQGCIQQAIANELAELNRLKRIEIDAHVRASDSGLDVDAYRSVDKYNEDQA